MIYTLEVSKTFKKQFKRLSKADANLVFSVLDKLLNDIPLPAKNHDHELHGDYKGTRECHIKPDLLLIYQKKESVLILTALAIGNHSELFS